MIRLWIPVVLLALTISKVESIESEGYRSTFQRIPLTKCCSAEKFYRLTLDFCQFWIPGPLPTFPPVHSINDNSSLIRANSNDFSLTENSLAPCSPGYRPISSTEFLFYDDGSLLVADQTLSFQSDEFCLHQIHSEESSSVDAEWAARFCVEDDDPCTVETHCIRKCCPDGMAFNATSKLCLIMESSHNSSLLTTFIPVNFTVKDGRDPKCPFNPFRTLLRLDEFHILDDGRLNDSNTYLKYVEESDRITDEFCLELRIDGDEEEVMAIRCHGLPESGEEVKKIYPYLMITATIFLVATLIVYGLLPELRNVHGVTLMCYIGSMAVFYVGMCVVMMSLWLEKGMCIAIAIVTHLALLSTFTWLNVVCFDIWWTLKSIRQITISSGQPKLAHRFFFYSAYGWGVPFIIVLIGQILDNIKNLPNYVIRPRFDPEIYCWFYHKHYDSLWVYVYGPLAVLFSSNIVFFVLTALHLHKQTTEAPSTVLKNRESQKFRVMICLFLLMGVSWTTEIIKFLFDGSFASTFVTDIFNILTGLYIFVIFVCKPKVWNLLKARFLKLVS